VKKLPDDQEPPPINGNDNDIFVKEEFYAMDHDGLQLMDGVLAIEAGSASELQVSMKMKLLQGLPNAIVMMMIVMMVLHTKRMLIELLGQQVTELMVIMKNLLVQTHQMYPLQKSRSTPDQTPQKTLMYLLQTSDPTLQENLTEKLLMVMTSLTDHSLPDQIPQKNLMENLLIMMISLVYLHLIISPRVARREGRKEEPHRTSHTKPYSSAVDMLPIYVLYHLVNKLPLRFHYINVMAALVIFC